MVEAPVIARRSRIPWEAMAWTAMALFIGSRIWPQVAAAFGVTSANAAAPALQLTTLDGQSISNDSLRGKVVLVNFWATWCPLRAGHLDRRHHRRRARRVHASVVGRVGPGGGPTRHGRGRAARQPSPGARPEAGADRAGPRAGLRPRLRYACLTRQRTPRGRNWIEMRGPTARAVLGTACSQVRWQLPPITTRSPCPTS